MRVGAVTVLSFLARRWRGEVPVLTLFWRDTLLVGSIVNVLATFVALAIVSQDGPAGLAAVLHFLPLPYNLFLVAALWRAPERSPALRWASCVWLFIATLV